MNDKSILASKDAIKKPNLGGHNFTTVSHIKSPFINTSLEMVMGLGKTSDFELPPLQIDSISINVLKGDIAYTTLGLQYQTSLRDWLAFNAGFRLNGRVGTESRSLIAQGINLSTGFKLGWLAKLYESKKSMLSGSLTVSNDSYTIVDLEGFIKKIIESGTITEDNRLLQTVPALSVMGGVSYAAAFNETFGLISYVEGGFGESIDRSESDKWIVNLGVSFDYDMLPKLRVPLGFALGYHQNSTPLLSQERLGNPQNIIGMISYTGRDDLEAGIEFTYEWSKPESFNTHGKYLKFMNVYGKLKYYF